MKVIVYVEGPSDKLALEALLEPLIRRAAQNGCLLSFVPQNGKRPLLTKAPRKAVNILRNDRSAFVIVLPDLYPQGMVYPHSSLSELRQAAERSGMHPDVFVAFFAAEITDVHPNAEYGVQAMPDEPTGISVPDQVTDSTVHLAVQPAKRHNVSS